LNESKKPSSDHESAGDYSTGSPNALEDRSGLDLVARIEALLYVAPAPVTIGHLAEALNATTPQVKKALNDLADEYEQGGLRLQFHRAEVQITTAPELADDVERFLHIERTSRLTQAALEVLAIIAYQQPVTRPQIDSVRGVNSDSVLRTLLRYGLIEDAGRSQGPGRPFLYRTTSEFLQHFGLNALKDLPQIDIGSITELEDLFTNRKGELSKGE
jgi:segregation and condensation protein B